MEFRKIQISEPSLGEEEWQAVKGPIESGWLTQGPKVKAFEEAFAKEHNVKHAVATTSCTTALHLALVAMEVGPDDEVIVPAFTWIATANAVVYCGATPVFCDIDLETFNMCPKDLASKITSKTKVIIPVHLFGLFADMTSIKDIAGDILILEDAACAAGATLDGKYPGEIGKAAAFSFHPRKSITTGEGGMVTTNDDALAEKMVILRNHGASVSAEVRHQGAKPYLLPDFNHLGFNYRMSDVQAAIGLVQITKLRKFITERQYWADYYAKELADINWLRTPAIPQNCSPAYQAYVCFVDESKSPMPRNDIMEYLQENGIYTRPGTHAVHMLGYYKDNYSLKTDDYPNARDADQFSMAIPLHNKMTADDYAYVVDKLKNIHP
ncbi:MAG: DegT/DnrJ/EryC1/StrS family aminotransferase [Kordiimonadaceae bacterium]|jgi:perosamine synthetase|nr:DegT/DnrJ/EryC1/StrS family aminotransferase [Kordiimonadaceae bacterium]MBT6035088.1 DegT/DnrJ/EryC1/StrS family aminotransferase [Kordiimonadaceae bacterium]MBT6328781.1 DegT/DnrJ/EryC1/StrS family aminotransferase [Kordiimonadaceae bacterium]MBT7582803.1 DegT/DnrJ/EryC1/StrS family aminotransferase [Kordiimonadaceae bacterium]